MKGKQKPESPRPLERGAAERLGEIVEAAERAAASVIDDAETEARRYLAEAKVDKVFVAGPLMKALWAKLPKPMRGALAETAEELEPALADFLASGDVIMVKGSNASRLGPLVEKLKARYAPAGAAAARRQGEEIA